MNLDKKIGIKENLIAEVGDQDLGYPRPRVYPPYDSGYRRDRCDFYVRVK